VREGNPKGVSRTEVESFVGFEGEFGKRRGSEGDGVEFGINEDGRDCGIGLTVTVVVVEAVKEVLLKGVVRDGV
jgi:hypothetical protein